VPTYITCNALQAGGTLLLGGRRIVASLEGSQALPLRPSDKSRVKVKTSGRLEAVARGRGRIKTGYLLYDIYKFIPYLTGNTLRHRYNDLTG
jgi:hypothetical protein